MHLINCNSAGTRLDLWLLGANHLNHGEVVPFEAEGLLKIYIRV